MSVYDDRDGGHDVREKAIDGDSGWKIYDETNDDAWLEANSRQSYLKLVNCR